MRPLAAPLGIVTAIPWEVGRSRTPSGARRAVLACLAPGVAARGKNTMYPGRR